MSKDKTYKTPTSSAAASLAKMFLPQAEELASLVLEAASGTSSRDLSEKHGQVGLSLRMSPAEPRDGLMPCVGRWDSSGTKRYRSQLRRQMSALRICDGEYSLLPTPSASVYGTSGNGNPGDGRTEYAHKGTPSLHTLARQQGGHLCPQFVETMMGLARDWTVPDSEP